MALILTNQVAAGVESATFFAANDMFVLCRHLGRDVPAAGRRRGADSERAPGGRNELHRLEVLHGGVSTRGQSGHGYTPSWQEQ